MLPEQQQRILGYFLEEANDHLNTIEQGLLNLQSTLADSEMVNEIFRAAHSIKGGAAMLGLNSIQRTAHRLEDFFKILKECPSIQIEQTLESLFLQVFDNLKALLEQLQSGSSLSDSEASRLMSEVEPVFAALEHQLSVLVTQAGGSMHPDELPAPTATANGSGDMAIAPTWAVVFEHSVPEALRELLQLFKQPETAQTRQELQDCCNRLAQLGEQYNLSSWSTLCETAAGAIANADNSYRILAPVIIRELKQAQELILANRAAEITTCEQLQTLSINTFLLDWEEENTNLTSFELEDRFTENLTLAPEMFTPPAIVDNEVGFIPQEHIDSLSIDDDLSSLFIHKTDSNNQWQETTDLLDVLNDSSDNLSLQDIEAYPPISSEETSALNNLFGEAQDTLLDSIDEEPAFCNLFSAPTAEVESIVSLEELNPVGDISENVELNQFWTEETNRLVQDETPIQADNIYSLTEAIAPAEVQFNLVIPEDATIPQVEETWSAESDFNLDAIADSADGTASIDDSDATEPATAWNRDTEGLGLDFDNIPVIEIPVTEIDSSLSSISDSSAAESSLGWDDRSEGQLDLDLPAMELDDNLSLETEFNSEPLTASANDSNPDLMAGWDAGSEAFETGFDTVMELGDRPSLESEPSLELDENMSLAAEPDSDLFATSTPSNTDESSDPSATLMSGWDTDSEEPELSFATAADLFVSSASEEIEEIAVPNFLLEASTTEISAEDTELMAAGDAGSKTLEMGFDSDAVESNDSPNLELELNSDLLTDAAPAPADYSSSAELMAGWDADNAALEMPVDDESATANIAWDTGEVELSLGFDATPFESEESPNRELEPNLELDENFSLAAETPAEDTALMTGWDAENAEADISDDATVSTEDIGLMTEWDASNETLDIGSFDSAAIELGDRLSVDGSNSELFRLSALIPADDKIDDETATTASTAWDAGEAELNLGFDATPQESEETSNRELEPNLELDENFSLAAETPAEDTALMAEWDTENVALEMSVDAVTSTEDSELMAQWDAGSETLEMGFDSDAVESNDSPNLELELDSDLLTDAAPAPADDLGNAELMVGWDADNAVLEMPGDDNGNAASIAWDAGEAELNLGFDTIPQESEETPSFEPESNLELDNNFSLMTEGDADLFSSSTADIIDENITELMSVVESIYQNETENEISLEEAQADFLADSHLEADDDFPELDALLQEEESVTNAIATAEALLDLSSAPIAPAIDIPTATATSEDDFSDLDLLLQESPKAAIATDTTQSSSDDFGDLDLLLQTPPAKPASVVPTPPAPAPAATTPSPRRPAFEQMMRVPVKQLDNIGNMVGELVVYRNSLEQDQERLRQFLDNLLHQVQQLGDVGTRMQELYERSLLEASLLNSRQGGRLISVASDDATSTEGQHATGANFDALEMDRFTGFHTLAQEMIELIVRVREASSDIEFVTGETEQVARNFRQVTTHLQEGITRSRMVPFSQIAERLPRAVRDIALKYGKQAELQVEGNETLIDKGILEQLYDPMTHLVNNAITHGIETPEERIAKGKAAAGKITIRAFYQGNQTVIAVSDDGAGIDPEKVKAKAIANGLITAAEADSMDRLDVFNLIFQPGFSTKDQVDQFAGRGIGMDVVLTSLKQMRGTIHTDSNLGKGTNFTIRLPLTLSICKALCCVSDKARIAFPMDGVEQMIDIPVGDVVTNAEGQTCIPWRDSLLPFRPLKELLGFTRQLGRGSIYGSSREDNAISIVILRSADTFFALQVDQVLGEQEIVIKQFEAPAPKPAGIAGATILGDGRIVPIADVLELIDLSVGRIQKDGKGTVWSPRHIPAPPTSTAPVKTEPLVLIIDDSITVRELLSMTFTNAGYRVEQARDGQEAWDKLRDGLPCDLVFCDIEMPRMDGLELLSRMQKEERLSQLPIAMLTSRGSDRHRQMALQLGASGYFTKPYLEEALLDGAQRMLRGEVLITASSASSV